MAKFRQDLVARGRFFGMTDEQINNYPDVGNLKISYLLRYIRERAPEMPAHAPAAAAAPAGLDFINERISVRVNLFGEEQRYTSVAAAFNAARESEPYRGLWGQRVQEGGRGGVQRADARSPDALLCPTFVMLKILRAKFTQDNGAFQRLLCMSEAARDDCAYREVDLPEILQTLKNEFIAQAARPREHRRPESPAPGIRYRRRFRGRDER